MRVSVDANRRIRVAYLSKLLSSCQGNIPQVARARGAKVDRQSVSDALNDLTVRDWLIRRESISGQQIYSLNPARRTELQQLCDSCQ